MQKETSGDQKIATQLLSCDSFYQLMTEGVGYKKGDQMLNLSQYLPSSTEAQRIFPTSTPQELRESYQEQFKLKLQEEINKAKSIKKTHLIKEKESQYGKLTSEVRDLEETVGKATEAVKKKSDEKNYSLLMLEDNVRLSKIQIYKKKRRIALRRK